MADKRGGARTPKKPSSYSGVGKNSKRTDGQQPVRAPHVQEGTDLTQGDRRTIEAGMESQPLTRATPPSLAGAPPRDGSSGPIPGAGAELPPHIFEMPTNRPDEPETTGLPFGPGGGPEVLQSYQAPDDREILLRFLARGGNEDANRMLSGMVESKRPPEVPAMPLLSSAEPFEDEMIEVPEDEEPIEDIAPEDLPPEELNEAEPEDADVVT